MAWAALTEGLPPRAVSEVEAAMVLDFDPFPVPSFGEGPPPSRGLVVAEVDTSTPGTNVASLMAAMRTGRVG